MILLLRCLEIIQYHISLHSIARQEWDRRNVGEVNSRDPGKIVEGSQTSLSKLISEMHGLKTFESILLRKYTFRIYIYKPLQKKNVTTLTNRLMTGTIECEYIKYPKPIVSLKNFSRIKTLITHITWTYFKIFQNIKSHYNPNATQVMHKIQIILTQHLKYIKHVKSC